MNSTLREAYVIALRDWKKKDKWWRYLISISLIIAVIYVVGFGIGSITTLAGSYTSFFSYGMMVYIILISGIGAGSDLILDRTGFIKILLVSPVSKYAILLGQSLSLLVGSLRFYIIIGLFFLIIFDQLSIIRLLSLILFTLYLMLSRVAAGLFISSIFRGKTTDAVLSTSGFFILFLSGIIFPITSMPSLAQMILRLNPIIYIVDFFRYMMSGVSEFPLLLNVIVSLGFGIAMITGGIYFYDRNIRR